MGTVTTAIMGVLYGVLLLTSVISVTDCIECYSCVTTAQCVTPGVAIQCSEQDKSCIKQWRNGRAISWGCSSYPGPSTCLSEKSGQNQDTTCYCQEFRCNYANRISSGLLIVILLVR